MARVRSEHGRESARDSVMTAYPVQDVEFHRLRGLASDEAGEAERLEPESGHLVESGELIPAALDAAGRDYFKRAVLRAMLRRAR